MSVHYDPDRKRFVVRWREAGRQRSKRFRLEEAAVAFDAARPGRKHQQAPVPEPSPHGGGGDGLRPVMYRGELVALAGRRRFHLLAPWLDDRPDSDPELRFVTLLCLYHRQVLRGELPRPADPDMAERWARVVLDLPDPPAATDQAGSASSSA